MDGLPLPTPRQLGYRLPAEWEPQRATWMIWPHDPEKWLVDVACVREVYSRLAAAISRDQPVEMLVENEDVAESARQAIAGAGGDASAVRYHVAPTDDAWIRDSGALFLTRENASAPRALVGWRFNGWGEKFAPWDRDAEVPRQMSSITGLPIFEPGLCLEGGSIEGNGAGVLLTTEQCLLHPGRNPRLSKEAIEAALLEFFGAEQVLWLGRGLEGDDTDGHVDTLTRFVAPRVVVTSIAEDAGDANAEPLRENLVRLRRARLREGGSLEILTLPTPAPRYVDDRRLAASYANFALTNRQVIVPFFDDPNDERALAILQSAFPSRRAVGIVATPLVRGGSGALHCVTMNEPALP